MHIYNVLRCIPCSPFVVFTFFSYIYIQYRIGSFLASTYSMPVIRFLSFLLDTIFPCKRCK